MGRGLTLAEQVVLLCEMSAPEMPAAELVEGVAVAGAVLLVAAEEGSMVVYDGRVEGPLADPSPGHALTSGMAPPVAAREMPADAWLLAAARGGIVQAAQQGLAAREKRALQAGTASRRAAMLLDAAGWVPETFAGSPAAPETDVETAVCQAVAEAAQHARHLFESALLAPPASGLGTSGLGLDLRGWFSRLRRRSGQSR